MSKIIVEKLLSLYVQGADIVEKFNELGELRELREMLREFKVKPINPFEL